MLLPNREENEIKRKGNNHTGRVLGNVSRRCRRRLFLESLLATAAFALTSRIDVPFEGS
jgi:hypothetical protein